MTTHITDTQKTPLLNPQKELENIYEFSANGLGLLDSELRFVHLNQRLADLNDTSISDHIGKTLAEINPLLAEPVEKNCRDVMTSGQPIHDREFAYREPSRQWPEKYLRFSCSPIQEAGLIIGANIILQDISHTKMALQQVEERTRFENLLTELSARFVNLPSQQVDLEIEHVLQRVSEILGIERIEFTEVTEQNEFKTIYSYSSLVFSAPIKEYLKRFILSDKLLPWYSEQLHAGKTVKISNPDELPAGAEKEREYFARSGCRSVLTTPLAVGGTIRYTFVLESFTENKDWPDDLVPRLQLLGELFTNAFERKKSDESLTKAFAEINRLKDQLEAEWSYLQDEIKQSHNFDEIIGQSKSLKTVFSQIEKIAPIDTTALILGETGTGKELVARAVHHLSPRKERPMVKVNCAALPATLIESELFGHEKGAFTGAHTRKIGRFELANGSTIFLDEIGELPLELQPKLLRVLQEGEFERVGGAESIKTDVRIIAATNRKLEEEVEQGRFREDLWYRLNVYPISLPPLRERKEDIPLLVNFFVRKLSKKMGTDISRIPVSTLNNLQNYDWPGNVRELENVIERALISSHGKALHLAVPLESPRTIDTSTSDRKTLDDLARDHILETLEETRWRVSGPNGAAVLLGINPHTLRSRMRKLGIK